MDDIKTIRAKLGLSQDQFATLLGVAQARVSDWERGKHKPHWRTMTDARRLLQQHEAAQGSAPDQDAAA